MGDVGYHAEGVTFTRSQHKNITRLYGIDEDAFRKDAEALVDKATADKAAAQIEWDNATPGERIKNGKPLTDPSKIKIPDPEADIRFMQAGSYRNVYRAVERDGLRLMAALSKYLEPGDDPVKFVLQMMADSGFDVAEGDWLYETPDDEKE